MHYRLFPVENYLDMGYKTVVPNEWNKGNDPKCMITFD